VTQAVCRTGHLLGRPHRSHGAPREGRDSQLDFGHPANAAFAVEASLIGPLPHQRLTVYEYLLPQTRLRFLLADNAGAGKTIMVGLFIKELMTRGDLQKDTSLGTQIVWIGS
jgi:hypothetical protein